MQVALGTVEGESHYYELEIKINAYSNPNQVRPFCDPLCYFNSPLCCDSAQLGTCTTRGRCDSLFFYCLRAVRTSSSQRGCTYRGSRLSSRNLEDARIDFSNGTVLGLENPLILQGLTTTWNVSADK